MMEEKIEIDSRDEPYYENNIQYDMKAKDHELMEKIWIYNTAKCSDNAKKKKKIEFDHLNFFFLEINIS